MKVPQSGDTNWKPPPKVKMSKTASTSIPHGGTTKVKAPPKSKAAGTKVPKSGATNLKPPPKSKAATPGSEGTRNTNQDSMANY